MRVVPVRTGAQLKRFITFPWKIYPCSTPWVPPLISQQRKLLDRRRHPFHRHAEVEYFLALEQGQVKGTVAAIVNHAHNDYHGERTGFFGFFECVAEGAVASVLLDACANWLARRGMDCMRGPANFSTNESCGLLVQGFHLSPCVLMPYNPPYYAELLENWGLQKCKDLLAYYVNTRIVATERLARIVNRLSTRAEVKVRHARMKHYRLELEHIRRIYNQAWKQNWGFVPMSDEEFEHMARELKPLVVPELVLFAELDSEPVAFALCLPDYNMALRHLNGRLFPWGWLKFLYYRRRIELSRVITLGVLQQHRRKGLDALLILEIIKRSPEKGCWQSELSWILEDNLLMKKALRAINAFVWKVYRIYERKLG